MSRAAQLEVKAKPENWDVDEKKRRTLLDYGKLTDAEELQLDYWGAFNKHGEDNPTSFTNQPEYKPISPRPKSWIVFRRGEGVKYQPHFKLDDKPNRKPQQNSLRVELLLEGRNAMLRYGEFERQRDEIEQSLGKLIWQKNQKSCYIRIERQVEDPYDRTQWSEHLAWTHNKLADLYSVCNPIIRELSNQTRLSSELMGTEN